MARFDAIVNPTFQRAMRLITAITNTNPAQVTTSFPHNYGSGDIVRLHVPHYFKMHRADKLVGEIIVTGPTTFTINIDTTGFNPFVAPAAPEPWYIEKYACVTPVGEIAANLSGATRNVLPY